MTADAYAKAGIATLRKVDPPVRVMWLPDAKQGGKKTQRVIFQKNPYLDCLGVWTSQGGRMLMIECKSTATHRLPFKRDGGLTEEQFAAVKAWSAAGAAVGLLWKWASCPLPTGSQVVLFTPQMLMAADEFGAKSLLFAAGLPVPRGTGFVIWDFLPALAPLIVTVTERREANRSCQRNEQRE